MLRSVPFVGIARSRPGFRTKIANHTFRATGITEYLRNARKLEIAQQMTNHKSARDQGTMIDGMIR